MIMGVKRRHTSEGGNYRVTEKKCAASAKRQHRMHEGENKM